jgi:hypothetical protein
MITLARFTNFTHKQTALSMSNGEDYHVQRTLKVENTVPRCYPQPRIAGFHYRLALLSVYGEV